MLPAAPLTFSMTTGCPSGARIRSAMTRASVSIGPPAANGTTIVIGRDGKVCAVARFEPAMASIAARAIIRLRLVVGAGTDCDKTVLRAIISLLVRLIGSRICRRRSPCGRAMVRPAQRTFLHQAQRDQ